MVGVGRGDQQVVGWNPAGPGHPRADLIDQIPGQGNHIAGDHAERRLVVHDDESPRPQRGLEHSPRGERGSIERHLAGRGTNHQG